jgi:hypothetical protein
VPKALSISPDHGTGLGGTFRLRFTDPLGAGDIGPVELRFQGPSGACVVTADPESQRVSLQVRPEGASGIRTAGNVGSVRLLENPVCSVDLSGVYFKTEGKELEVGLPITFTPEFVGVKEVTSSVWDRTVVGHPGGRAKARWTVGKAD